MTTLIRIDKNGSKHYEGMVTCDRCFGKGYYAIGVLNNKPVLSPLDHGVCWKCGGTGKVKGKWIERTPEYQAKLDARREAKARIRQAEFDAQRAEAQRYAEAQKQAEEARIKAQKAISQWIGEIGQKITVKVTFTHSAWYETKSFTGYGTQTVYIHNFKDENGNVLIWKTASNSLHELEDGQTVELTGIIKEHSEYKEEKQTVLTRCKVK